MQRLKKLGLVGGIGPASTITYYQKINEGYQSALTHPPKCGASLPMVIDSLDLSVAYDLVDKKDWDAFTSLFVNSICTLHRAGAEIAAITANTAHIVFEQIAKKSPIPVIGLVDETCKFAKSRGIENIIVFGTAFTMSSGMYEAQCEKYGITVVVPTERDRQVIHNIIFPNLVAGIVTEEDRHKILEIANRMLQKHPGSAIALACTELPLILSVDDIDAPLLDTTSLHIQAILQKVMERL